ncbi:MULTISPECIES: hypothetical protein [Protofrankia]|uniref:Uncharacterized protein n=1 Tax=Protofrankia coriariae TaxID=1562887 RepID=A0ABR5EZI8_9ACTN|nr:MULTISPECIES: hypothetical protein [Protofrankia]KLL09870.1 hypothetical protein FrCorBMG51_21790 [Protofrankia coriariae]ONH34191.1 hypothetical protein BL254_17510 [Protofrankia sp. BMG5.30]
MDAYPFLPAVAETVVASLPARDISGTVEDFLGVADPIAQDDRDLLVLPGKAGTSPPHTSRRPIRQIASAPNLLVAIHR